MIGVKDVFIDKDITAGEEWLGFIQERIRSCRYFIVLVGPHTLESPVVQQEIATAASTDCRIISMWHHGTPIGPEVPESLKKLHAITVMGESARDYETAISQLLNSLGYQTY